MIAGAGAFRALGFEIHHTPGISRAWRRELEGGCLLVTNAEGFDLPDPIGPFRGFCWSDAGDSVDPRPPFATFQELALWVRRLERRTHLIAGPQTFLPF